MEAFLQSHLHCDSDGPEVSGSFSSIVLGQQWSGHDPKYKPERFRKFRAWLAVGVGGSGKPQS